IAHIAREAGCGDFIKIEVITDMQYLLPDNHETLKAAETLAKEDFIVLPYVMPDITISRQLYDAGAAAVMPLGSPIGSNRGLEMKSMIQRIIDTSRLPVIVDAGIGRPSQAAEAMEMGADAVLVNTAIATAQDTADPGTNRQRSQSHCGHRHSSYSDPYRRSTGQNTAVLSGRHMSDHDPVFFFHCPGNISHDRNRLPGVETGRRGFIDCLSGSL
ncbi:MAG: HisA/HisF-related TIM barrel protein, partial [Desulfotignum sp.]